MPGFQRHQAAIRTLSTSAILLCAGTAFGARSIQNQIHAVPPDAHTVSRATSEITVDGILDERAWSDALSLELSYEVRPGDNTKPPVRTVCLITYDDRRMLFAFRAYDPDPSQIRARYSDRDKAWNDDWVGVVLDTFNDERRAYELFSNPLGVQIDAINDDVSGNYDDSWNAIWKSAGRITSEGYEVEMAIPFNQIRFQSVNGEKQVWGFDANRSYPRSDRHHIGVFPRDRSNNSYLSQTIKLVGMEGASPGKNLEILPTLTATRTDTRDDLPDGGMERGGLHSDLGLTLRWGITPNASLNGAVNPDFSQVEADVLQLDINEQFTLFFPETRPFFLEGADYFSTPLDLVHTRTVVDPSAALKLTGKQGRHTYGVFSARDSITTVIFPGPQGSSSANFDMETAPTVGRYRYDFGKNSTVGGAFTDRSGGGYSNRVASADAAIRFTEKDRLKANLATSRTRYSEEMVDGLGAEEDPFTGRALFLQYNHSVRNWWVELDHFNIGNGFRSDIGFRPQVGFRDYWFGGARIWWGEDGDYHRRMAWGGGTGIKRQQDGELLRDKVETWFNLDGPKQSFLGLNLTFQNQGFGGVEFEDQLLLHTFYEIQAVGDFHFSIHADYGDWIDYELTRPALRTLIQPGVRYNLGRHLVLQYNHTYSALEVDGGRLFRVHAPELRVVHQFNTRSFVRAILQYTDIERNVNLYEDEDALTNLKIDAVDRRSRDLFGQLLFTYKVNPQTALYVGYTDNYVGEEEYGLTRAERSLFLKLGYAFVR